uniref:Uncharacterized protein n=1 Tax=Pipistrellus kuhlii TaxID=59472 RepID=A0A7J8A9N3_PIPKU|nr:hypothetical protein mPipKuh1_009033 [Pipistrellus kuhlii]
MGDAQGGPWAGLRGEGAEGPGSRAHPHRHFGDLCPGRQSAPSSEQEGGAGRPGARPPAPSPPSPCPPGAFGPGRSMPPPQSYNSRNQPAFLSKAPCKWGPGPTPTPLQASERRKAGWGVQCPEGPRGISSHALSGKGQCPPAFLQREQAVWDEAASTWDCV